jgi:hypothetical protein
MRLREFAAPKAPPKDANAIEADAIKRKQKELADRSAQLNVQKAQKKLTQQRQKARNPKNPTNIPN